MDRQAWEEIYETVFPRVFRALVAIGARPEEAEDALHDALVRALDGQTTIQRPAAWLFVVASRSWRRRRLRDGIFRPLRAFRGAAPAPEADRMTLLAELARLPLRQRQVIVLRYLLGLSQDDTARALGIARGTVAATTSQAIARLRQRLGAGT